jgi:hypothetical protein
MNKRIQELAAQAKDSVPKGILDVDAWIEQYNRIYAELILRECADLFKLVHTDEQYQRRIDKTILKHFGMME